MNNRKLQPLLGWAALVALALACGPFSGVNTGATETTTAEFDADEAETLAASISIGAGDLTVGDGASGLVAGEFEYNVAEWEPIIESSGDETEVSWSVRQPEFQSVPFGEDIENSWDIRFDDDVALVLSIDLGAGQATIDLSALDLRDLEVNAGAGDVELVVDGDQLSDVDISAGVGQFNIDFSGNWETDASIDISGGVGDIRLILPEDVGVIVNVSVGVGDVNASGLTVNGDTYTNGAYDDADVTLTINLSGGVGAITLETE